MLPGSDRLKGIYTEEQVHAKVLAVAVGATKEPEIHNSGYYGHYHDGAHNVHIWYGNPIEY